MTGELSAVQAVAAVMADLPAVGKDSQSGGGGQYSYRYRGIDDVINALAGPMRRHGLVLVPHVIDCDVVPMQGRNGWTETRMTVEYDVVGPDGSTLPRPVRTFAIGADNGDKGPGKALSYAFKSAVSQLFAIPTDDPAMDNEQAVIPDAEPMVSDAQAQRIRDKFLEVADDEVRARLQREWSESWGRPADVLASSFVAAFKDAGDLVAGEVAGADAGVAGQVRDAGGELIDLHPGQGGLLDGDAA